MVGGLILIEFQPEYEVHGIKRLKVLETNKLRRLSNDVIQMVEVGSISRL